MKMQPKAVSSMLEVSRDPSEKRWEELSSCGAGPVGCCVKEGWHGL